METLFPMADLSTRWGVTPNTVSRRLAFLGIKPVRQGNFRFLDEGQLALAEELHRHVLSGKPMEAFPRPNEDAAPITRRAAPKADSHETLAATVAAVLAATTSSLPAAAVDPLRRAKALAEAADNALVLTTDELVALGVKGVDGFADGDLAYGYLWQRHSQRNRVLWTVHRAIASREAGTASSVPALTAAKGDKRVGFDVAAAITLEPVESCGSRLFAINALH